MNVVPLLLAAALPAAGGYADIHSPDIQSVSLLLASCGWVLGALYPDGAWRRALVLGASVPLAHLVARYTGATLPHGVEHATATYLAVIPAMIGTYAGVLMRRVVLADHRERSRTQ